ncbi:MAG: DUF1854 domain-containing protein [Prosthecobacter sp.]|uniref:DUF1854 domain-containing protein n=1 Tax=Prosthecobacter sp. TaxID=1965333 RepID=UPI003BAE5367
MSTPQPLNIEFAKESQGRLALVDSNGIRHTNVHPVKLFPLTEKDHWISIQSEGAREILCIEDPQSLPEPSRTLLLEALARRDFVPIIQVIHRIVRLANGHEWHVTTDRGDTSFEVETDESIQPLGHGRLVVVDRGNTRYLIPNIARLDRISKRKLEHYY